MEVRSLFASCDIRTDIRTDGRTDGQTKRLIESLVRDKKEKGRIKAELSRSHKRVGIKNKFQMEF